MTVAYSPRRQRRSSAQVIQGAGKGRSRSSSSSHRRRHHHNDVYKHKPIHRIRIVKPIHGEHKRRSRSTLEHQNAKVARTIAHSVRRTRVHTRKSRRVTNHAPRRSQSSRSSRSSPGSERSERSHDRVGGKRHR